MPGVRNMNLIQGMQSDLIETLKKTYRKRILGDWTEIFF
jgi:hypothetical protein